MPHHFPKGNAEDFFNDHGWDSAITELRYVGPWIGGQIQNATSTAATPTAAQTLSYLLKRAGQVRRGYGTHNAALEAVVAAVSLNKRILDCTDKGYLPGPVNRMAFNALIDLVAYAKDHAHPLTGAARTFLNKLGSSQSIRKNVICKWNEGTDLADDDGSDEMCDLGQPTAVYGSGEFAQALGKCPCMSKDACEHADSCSWVTVGNDEGCVVNVNVGARWGKRFRGNRREFSTWRKAARVSNAVVTPRPEWNVDDVGIYRHNGTAQIFKK